MAWTPLLLALLSHCTGSLSQQLVLTQPPSLSASLGSTITITCTLSSGFNVGGYHIRWYQQKPGSPPRYLLAYKSDSDKHQGSGVPSRFSGSKDASANAGLLTISGLQPEDEADYYCNVDIGGSSSYYYPQCLRERGSETKTPGPEAVALSLLQRGASGASVGGSSAGTCVPGGGRSHSVEQQHRPPRSTGRSGSPALHPVSGILRRNIPGQSQLLPPVCALLLPPLSPPGPSGPQCVGSGSPTAVL
ncbi:immunoglobulin gamma-1 heavy chain-like [Pipistrellus kuhlii]|uniref:immunoglobulin gamma-1 heavy chain-like n=1 Tax=Pipistrellus kuhlii TaxID=59472 RepID=UPI001E270347|nr:immunoglobulin gamma-1 heavy chain-like [Pipistrellus kuhlii]